MPSESYTSGLNFEETELSLCLPGETRSSSSSKKRGFSENVDLTLGCSGSGMSFHSKFLQDEYPSPNETSNAANKPPAKAQVVGWPPVKSSRMNMMIKSSKYVKVAADGAPYLRKIDLEMYNNYKQLLAALEDMFTCLTIRNVVNIKMLMDAADGMSQCVPTYEDRDGDWMLVGDVPWKMFVESCKRIRLMKSSEAIELPTNTSANCSSTC